MHHFLRLKCIQVKQDMKNNLKQHFDCCLLAKTTRMPKTKF